jgi:hypothetical protein
MTRKKRRFRSSNHEPLEIRDTEVPNLCENLRVYRHDRQKRCARPWPASPAKASNESKTNHGASQKREGVHCPRCNENLT